MLQKMCDRPESKHGLEKPFTGKRNTRHSTVVIHQADNPSGVAGSLTKKRFQNPMQQPCQKILTPEPNIGCLNALC